MRVLVLSLVVDGQGCFAAGPEVGFRFWVAEAPDPYVPGEEEPVFGRSVGAVVAAVFVLCVVLSPSGFVLALWLQILGCWDCAVGMADELTRHKAPFER